VLGYYVRERNALSLMDGLAKMTLLPAERVSGAAAQMKRKGRIQAGADADITVFDPATIIDRATYEKGDLPSGGIPYVMVGGTFVVYDSESVDGVFPGKAIVRGH
jgi:N-acyl-D-aspartate/D-glutamate deacylase